jgi:WD40 repeat protein
VSGSSVGEVQLWDLASGQLLKKLQDRNYNSVYSMAFSPRGRRIAIANLDGTARILDSASGEVLQDLQSHRRSPVASVAFSADGKQIVGGNLSGKDILIWGLIY